MDDHTRYVSVSDSQSTESMTMVKKAREESIIDNYEKGRDSVNVLGNVLRVLESLSDIAALTLEVRKLEQKVERMGKDLQLVIDEKETHIPISFKVTNRDLQHASNTTQSKRLTLAKSNQTFFKTETQEQENLCPVDKDWIVIGSGCYQINVEE